jgi:hypothetical protein
MRPNATTRHREIKPIAELIAVGTDRGQFGAADLTKSGSKK